MPGAQRDDMRILIVDDAAVERARLARIVEGLGHAAAAACSLPEALALLACEPPDLAIVDGRLPPAGAVPAIGALHAVSPRLRVVVTAAVGENDLLRAVRAAGAFAVLPRPFSATSVASLLHEIAVAP